METKIIEFKGKAILYTDYRGAKNDQDMLAHLATVEKMEAALKEKTPSLANFEGTVVSQNFMSQVKRSSKTRDEKISKLALLGITGLKKVLLSGYIAFTGAKNIQTFDSEEKALEWLVS